MINFFQPMKWTALIFLISYSVFINSEEENLPELGNASSSAISIASEFKLGRLYMAQIRRSVPGYDDPITQDYVEHLIYRLAEYSQLKDRRLEVALIDQKSVNAFAAPGGVIGINGGLIYQAETEGEFASVLAHEIAHLSQRHFARRLQRQKDRSLANALLILASVAVAAATNPEAILAGQQIINQQSLAYSRGNEQEADRVGFTTMVRAGFDPLSMANMFEILQSLSRLSGSDNLEFLRSHPLTKKRISDSKIRADEVSGINYRNNLDYDLVKNRSKVHFTKQSRQAIAQFKQDLRRSKSKRQRISSLYGLALSYSKGGDDLNALTFSRKALALDKENLLLQTLLVEVHLNAGNNLEAEALSKSLLEVNPANYPLTVLYSKTLTNNQKFDKAEEVIRKLSLTRSTDPQVWYWLAEIQGLAKNIIGLHQSRAEYFFLTGSYDLSIKHLRWALELSGNNFQLSESIYNRIERAHRAKEDLKEFS